MESKIKELREEFLAELAAADAAEKLEALRVSYLGKKGRITDLLKGLRDLSNEEKKEAGQLINTFKGEAEAAIAARGEELRAAAIEREIKSAKKYRKSNDGCGFCRHLC